MLWNVAIHELLKKLARIDCLTAIAFADDLTLTLEAHNHKGIKRTFEAMERVLMNWCRQSGLMVSTPKSSIMQFAGKRLNLDEFKLYGERIRQVKNFKHVGIVIDEGLNFRDHIDYVDKKANKMLNAFNWIVRSNEALHFNEKMIVYKSVLIPLAMYGSEIWHPVLQYETHRMKLRKIQRKFLISALRAYRTTSYESIYEITGLIALDLEATYRLLCYRKRTEKNGKLDEEEKAEYRAILKDEHSKFYTEKLRVKIDEQLSWTEIICPEVVYVATGHGPFSKYLNRFNVTDDVMCRMCAEEEEDVEHFQEGCPALDFNLSRVLKSKNETIRFKQNCVELIGRLRQAETERQF